MHDRDVPPPRAAFGIALARYASMNKILLPLTALLLLVSVDAAFGDVVRLRTGEVIKGRPLREKSDEYVLVIEDVARGLLRSISWEAVSDADRKRLQAAFHITNPGLAVVAGHRVTITLEGGGTVDVVGRIVERSDAGVTILQGGKEVKIPAERIVAIRTEVLDPRDVWRPEKLFERFLARLQKDGVDLTQLSAREHFRIAEYARLIGLFAIALEHYRQSAADKTFLSAHIAAKRVAEVEVLLQEKSALKDLRAIRTDIRRKAYRRARTLMEAFKKAHPEPPPPVAFQAHRARLLFVAKRGEHMQREAKIRAPKIARRLIQAKVREPDVTLADVTAWARRELPELMFAGLAQHLMRWDDVTLDEGRMFWENGRRSSWHIASYGSGTFIVEPPKVKKPLGNAEKPMTRDRWWFRSSPAERASWLTAWFAERSGLFDISDVPTRVQCVMCAGRGVKGNRLCPRCQGTRYDKRVRFR